MELRQLIYNGSDATFYVYLEWATCLEIMIRNIREQEEISAVGF